MAPRAHPARRRAERRADRPRRRRLRPAWVLRVRHRDAGDRRPGRRGRPADQFPHHRAVLTHPGLPPHGEEPPPQRHGPRGRPRHRVSGVLGPPTPRERLPLRDPADRGYATYAVGKWHLSPEGETNMANSWATWPLGRGFDRWYGFHGGETHQFVPALYHDNHAVRPPPRSRTATTSAPTWPTGPSSSWGTCAPSTTSCLSSSTSPPVPATRRTTRPPSGSSTTGATSPRGGTSGATRPSPASWPGASSPRAPCSRPARPGSRAGTAWRTSSGCSPSASWSASPPSSPTPTSRSGGSSTSSRRWGTPTTPS